jgi:hypothetical protein
MNLKIFEKAQIPNAKKKSKKTEEINLPTSFCMDLSKTP